MAKHKNRGDGSLHQRKDGRWEGRYVVGYDDKGLKVLTPEEIQRLLIQAREDGCYELLLLELSTGLRRGEICALQWNDLNLKTGALQVERQVHRVRGKLVVSPPKTTAGRRTVLLPPPVLNVLKSYRTTSISRWMFPSPVKEDSPMDLSLIHI